MTDALVSTGTDSTGVVARQDRSEAIDALRAATTLLVVLHHTAIAYGAMGGWFYREVMPGDNWGSRFLTFFCAVNQAFFMGLFFLLAGYFTPGALARKGPARFMRDRIVRLGIPLALFGWVLGPATVALAQTQRGRPFLATAMQMWRSGAFEPGPLWFCGALLIFSAFAALWRSLAPAAPSRQDAPPGNRTLLAAAAFTAAAAFGLRLAWPVGTEWHAFQLGYFASYVVLFVAGIDAAATGWLEHPNRAQVRVWRRVTWVALPVLPAVALSSLQGTTAGGWSVPALAYALWKPLVAWGLILALLATFKEHFGQGPRWRTLSRRAYAIFVIHPPVVVGVTIAMRDVPAPALLKFMLAGTVSCMLCYLFAGWVLRVPGARRVF